MTIVLEVGKYNTRIGYAGEAQPRIITPSFSFEAQQDMHQDVLFPQKNKRLYGHLLDLTRTDISIHSVFNEQYPKTANDFSSMSYSINPSKYLEFIGDLIGNLKQNPSSPYNLLVSEEVSAKPHQLHSFRETLTNHLFEKDTCSALYFAKSPVLACYAQGRTNAIVVDSGDCYTRISSVHDGYHASTKTINYGGKFMSQQIKQYLSSLNKDKSLLLHGSKYNQKYAQYLINRQIEQIKQRWSTPENSLIENQEQFKYTLPDQSIIDITKSKVNSPFSDYSTFKQNETSHKKHHNFPDQYKGIHNEIISCLLQTQNPTLRSALQHNIIFTGGNMMFKDIQKSIQNKTSEIADKMALGDIGFVENREKKNCNWIGGSVVSNLPMFLNYLVPYKEWKEMGISAINKKCPL